MYYAAKFKDILFAFMLANCICAAQSELSLVTICQSLKSYL